MRRPLLVLLLALAALGAALALSACGGGGGGEASSGTAAGDTTAAAGQTSEDPFAQLRFILAKFPYRPWYRDCLVKEVEGELSAEELEELGQLPQEQARRVAVRYALSASPKCEQEGRKPIDPDADAVEVQLLRVGFAGTLEALGRREGLSSKQASCLSETISRFPDRKVIALGNAGEAAKEKILVGVIEGCAS
jgi:hypothetical protein